VPGATIRWLAELSVTAPAFVDEEAQVLLVNGEESWIFDGGI